jgi:hypothetical protein
MKKRTERVLFIVIIALVFLIIAISFLRSDFVRFSPSFSKTSTVVKNLIGLGSKNIIQQTVCEENWQCGEWGDCAGGKQIRNCEDVNDCGTTTIMPEEEQSCEELPPEENLFKYSLSAADKKMIANAKTKIIQEIDYSGVDDLVISAGADKSKIYAYCSEIAPVYCLKFAAYSNPKIRSELCRQVETKVTELYPNANAEGHKQECELGIRPKIICAVDD